jgi:hypothetical protein
LYNLLEMYNFFPQLASYFEFLLKAGIKKAGHQTGLSHLGYQFAPPGSSSFLPSLMRVKARLAERTPETKPKADITIIGKAALSFWVI